MFDINPFPFLIGELDRTDKILKEMIRPYPEETHWPTENEIVHETDAYRLRRFSDGGDGRAMLIIPPQAGQQSNICDFDLPGRSLVQTCRDNGIAPFYSVDWKSANETRANETMDDLIRYTDQCVDLVGGSADLVGLCQGGWQAAIYTSLFPDKVSSLILAGSPIDFDAGDGQVKKLVRGMPLDFYTWLVMMGGGVMRGEFLRMGFKNLKPFDRYVGVYLDLIKNIEDPDYVERYRPFRDWYESPVNLSGAWYLQAVRYLFNENRLVKGQLTVMGQKVDLKKIECPVVLMAGEKDHITPVDQVFNAADYVRTGQITRILVPDCGHIGIFMGKNALEHYWPQALQAISQG